MFLKQCHSGLLFFFLFCSFAGLQGATGKEAFLQMFGSQQTSWIPRSKNTAISNTIYGVPDGFQSKMIYMGIQGKIQPDNQIKGLAFLHQWNGFKYGQTSFDGTVSKQTSWKSNLSPGNQDETHPRNWIGSESEREGEHGESSHMPELMDDVKAFVY